MCGFGCDILLCSWQKSKISAFCVTENVPEVPVRCSYLLMQKLQREPKWLAYLNHAKKTAQEMWKKNYFSKRLTRDTNRVKNRIFFWKYSTHVRCEALRVLVSVFSALFTFVVAFSRVYFFTISFKYFFQHSPTNILRLKLPPISLCSPYALSSLVRKPSRATVHGFDNTKVWKPKTEIINKFIAKCKKKQFFTCFFTCGIST